jgi:hypothetical protein
MLITGTAKIYENTVAGSPQGCAGGGGVWAYYMLAIRENASIYANTVENMTEAYCGGGGVYGYFTDLIIGENVCLYRNAAKNCTGMHSGGGGIYNVTTEPSHTLQINDHAKIYGNVAPDGGGIYNYYEAAVKINDDVEITDNEALSSGGGIWQDYDALDRLDVAENVTFSSNRATRGYTVIPPDIPLHDAHIHTHSFTSPYQYGYNNLDISYFGELAYLSVRHAVTAVKTVRGPKNFARFPFCIEGNGIKYTAMSEPCGRIVFPAIAYASPGTYTYTVRELAPGGRGWLCDKRKFTVNVRVSLDGGILSVTQDIVPHFVNCYAAPVIKPTREQIENGIAILAKVCTSCKCIYAGEFTFELYRRGCVKIAEATNDSAGNIVFVVPCEDGQYVIKQRCVYQDCWLLDRSAIRVTVSGGGVDTVPVFTNRWCEYEWI